MKYHKLRPTAALLLAITLLLSLLPTAVFAASSGNVTEPEIKSVSVPSVKAGQSFDASLSFYHNDAAIDSAQSAVIEISNYRGLNVKNNKFVVPVSDPATNEDTNHSDNGKYYTLYIPEKYLTYIGPVPGVIKFTITYYEDSQATEGKEVTIEDKNGKSKIYKVDSRKTLIPGDGSADDTVRVDETSATPTIESGASATVGIPLISSGTLQDVQIAVKTPADAKITLTSAGAVYTMSFVAGERKYLNLPLRVDPSVSAGIYPLTLTVNGGETTAYLKVTDSAQGKGRVVVDSYKLDRSKIYSGASFRLDLVLKNTGGQTYHNVTAALDGLATDGLTVVGSLDRKIVESLVPGASVTVSFEMQAASKMETGNYAVGVNLTSDEVPEPAATKVFVAVTGTGDSNGGKPIIIIESYSFGGTSVTGGKTFPLALRLKNASTGVAIQNLKITISSTADEDTGGVFTPASSSNTFFVSKLGANAAIEKTIELYPKADAKPKSYGIDVKFEYESAADSKHEQISATETISIPLTQPDRFEVTNAEVQGPISMGTEGQLNISYVNKGKSTVYNLSVLLEGNFTAPEMNIYVGNVESGASDSYDTTLTPAAEGTLKGTATITYEDPNGDTQKIIKDFSCEVQPAMPVDQGGMDPGEPVPEPNSGFPVWGIALIVLFVLGGGTAAFVIIRRKRAAKRLALQEQEDDYDDEPAALPQEHHDEDRS